MMSAVKPSGCSPTVQYLGLKISGCSLTVQYLHLKISGYSSGR